MTGVQTCALPILWIEIDQQNALPHDGQACRQVDGRGGLADAPFLVRDSDDLTWHAGIKGNSRDEFKREFQPACFLLSRAARSGRLQDEDRRGLEKRLALFLRDRRRAGAPACGRLTRIFLSAATSQPKRATTDGLCDTRVLSKRNEIDREWYTPSVHMAVRLRTRAAMRVRKAKPRQA